MKFNVCIKSILFFSLLSPALLAQKQDDKDFYEKIAHLGGVASMRPMDTIQVANLNPKKVFSWHNSRQYAFPHVAKISNKKEMQRGLEDLKQRFLPFLKNYAPHIEDARLTKRIDQMAFRYETDEDRKDFIGLVQGKGQWELVNMPYYHGPQGISTAWYRTEIEITPEFFNHPSLWLHFNGADYYTDVFINGFHVGSHEGMLDAFSLSIKKYAHVGKNTLLVRVRNDYSMLGGEGIPRYWGNKLAASNSPGWNDPESGWSCAPAGFGIYQELYLEARSVPHIADVFCRPLYDESKVELWVELDLDDGTLANYFSLECGIYGQNFQADVFKQKYDSVEVVGGRVLKRFLIDIPTQKMKTWSPDTPWLYQAQVKLFNLSGTTLLDVQKRQFGMRKFVIDKNSVPKGRFYLNNQEVRLRGTNTMGFLQQDVIKRDWEQLIDDLLLAKLTNMNFIRTTQRILPKEVYDYADCLGMMMQADLPLFAYLNQKQYTEIIKQADGIERVLRNHPSVILMSYMNEPMGEVKPHAVSRYAYERLFDALDVVVQNVNPDRAVKYVDGDYQAPNNGYPDNHCYNIWYDEHAVPLEKMCRGAWVPVSKGWMYGCGEFGAEGLDFVDLMKRRYPKKWLDNQIDGTWSPINVKGKHSGEQTMRMHWDWFETQTTMPNWVAESHKHQAWGVSKVARAFRRMPRMNSFAVHLFIDAWPNGWMKAIMDCERTPKPAWFLYRDALTPLAVQIESERRSFYSQESYPFQIWICNDTSLKREVELRYMLELDGQIINTGTASASLPTVSEGALFQGFLPITMPVVNRERILKVHVGLFDKCTGKLLHEESSVCNVFPSIKQMVAKRNIHFVGDGADVIALKNVFGLMKPQAKKVGADSDFIIVGNQLKQADIERIDARVQQGAKVLILCEALDAFKAKFKLNISKEDDSWIVARNRSHPWVKDLETTDLKYNYSSLLGSPERHFFTPFNATGVIPVLTQKEGLVVGEIAQGKGRWILCGLKLAGKIDTTPSLMAILTHMLNDTY